MKTKIVLALSTVFLLSAVVFSTAKAENDIGVNVSANANIELETRGNETSSVEKATIRGNATSTVKRDDNSDNSDSIDTEDDQATSTDENTNGKFTSEEHRSAVASFVESLLNVADREGGIGEQVREIAKEQNDSATTTASAMEKVEERGSLRTFFFGSDYKNLGVIRSELATTTNNISRLKSLLDKTTNVADKVELNAQIQVLEDEQVKVNVYVSTHENVFSLFGWFVKLFAK